MKDLVKETLNRLLEKASQPQLHSLLYSQQVSVSPGAVGISVSKSSTGLPAGATIQGLIVEGTPSNGFVVGNAIDLDANTLYVGLYNLYNSTLTGPVQVRILYAL